MKIETQTDERLPVWGALSEFFLDTELVEEDYERIAKTLSQSPYTPSELWDILRWEVYPSCIWNLRVVAGEWALFQDDWIMERIAPRKNRRPRFYWPFYSKGMFYHHWEAVKKLMNETRAH